ncbi:MAG TPA: DNA replication and repair protein RecF [Solirubrobacteraceae bacterium]|jgi:DNA replication and repair protein RecF|nr:DNA replication and repair protein RecF [Solirubrobacteraceae bacterium]
MRVLTVTLRDFRTYARAQAALGPGLTIVHGPNGAGKSNLLEGLYFGCTGHSLRARGDRELVRFGERATRVEVSVADEEGQHELSVGYAPGEGAERPTKRMTLDGADVERLTDVETRPLLGVFVPDRLELLKGPPAPRRAHLDRLVAALWPARTATRRAYTSALQQRNALLAAIRAGRGSRSTLPTWDRELARHAIALREDRARAVELLHRPFAVRAVQLGLSGEAALRYRPRSRATEVEQFVAELQERLSTEIERGFCAHGPHRDELAFLRDERELRSYGSQGELRITLLALLLAERDVLGYERRRTPLLLLDDVMSELDPQRRELLAVELAGAGQSVIATTDLTHVPSANAPHVTRLRVASGTILQEALAA